MAKPTAAGGTTAQSSQATAQAQANVPSAAQGGNDGGSGGKGDQHGQGNTGQNTGAQNQPQTAAGQTGGSTNIAEPGFTAALRDAPQTSSFAGGLVRQNVSLQEAVDAVKATFTTASQSGLTSARISLSPASLGSIEISLTQTSEGLVAHVTADHPDAVRTLQQNAADLRRSLEAGGQPLLQLDIGASGDQHRGSDNDPWARQSASDTGTTALAGADATTDESEQNGAASTLTIKLTGGSLVDVLA